MEFGKYVKDRHTEIIFGAVAFAIILLLLLAFHTPPALIIMVMAVFLIFMVAAFLWDYNRKRGFYQQLKENLNDLDKKNLAAEIISEPDFYEGKILHATLYEMGKSMTEQISKAEQSVTDFKDYVEMWVHEAKLPVAALLLKNFSSASSSSAALSANAFRTRRSEVSTSTSSPVSGSSSSARPATGSSRSAGSATVTHTTSCRRATTRSSFS